MNLILDVNDSLFSLQKSPDADLMVQSAIRGAFDDIKHQVDVNNDRKKKGLPVVPYKAVVKDDYGRDIVTIRQAESLHDIRNAYKKKVDALSYESKEKTLLDAMKEVGNSEKSEKDFKKELFDRLNSCLFVSDAKLSPGLEKILDYFGDSNRLFSTVNFKTDISIECIHELIDMPDPLTGKPPKSFLDLVRNLMCIDNIFEKNPGRNDFLEKARIYINMHYSQIIPKEYSTYFSQRGSIPSLIDDIRRNLENRQKQTRELEALSFEVNETNFKSCFVTLYKKVDRFRENPFELKNYLMEHVKPVDRQRVSAWLEVQGCHDDLSAAQVFKDWAEEKHKSRAGSIEGR